MELRKGNVDVTVYVNAEALFWAPDGGHRGESQFRLITSASS